jgi:hypothetical protein
LLLQKNRDQNNHFIVLFVSWRRILLRGRDVLNCLERFVKKMNICIKVKQDLLVKVGHKL